ncbi:hypothetical protein ACHAWT_007384 [Skeletonema menzelii]
MKFQSTSFPLAYTFVMLGGTAHGFIQSNNIIESTSLYRRTTQAQQRHQQKVILPSNVVKYSTVPKDKFFTIDTIPAGLLKEHSTKEGTWGVIRVHQGKLEYKILEPEQSVHILDAASDNIGIIEPTMQHQTKGLTDDLKFVVEFYRVPGTGDVDEQREEL